MLRKPVFNDHLFRSFISVASAVIILGLLTGTAIRSYSVVPVRVEVAGIHSSVYPVISDMYTFYAIHNRWPEDISDVKTLNDKEYASGKFGRFILDHGSVHVVIRSANQELNGKVISFRKSEVPDQIDAPMLWLCGYEAVPKGMVVDTVNRTNIDKKYMTGGCK
jgi:hypothetical protein